MLDDEARRALEEEAIALVSLSNPTTRFLDRPVEHTINSSSSSENRTSNSSVKSKALRYTQYEHHHRQEHQQQQGTNGGAIHPMLQVKANLIARRDGKLAGVPARKLRIKAGGDNPASERGSDEQGEKSTAFLSMEVYVDGETGRTGDDLKLAPHSNKNSASSNSSSHPSKRAMSHTGSEELYAQNPAVSEEQQQLDAQTGNISMKSLLVTLKKRKMSPHASTDAAAESERAKVLPSFRDVFESPHQAALSDSQTSSSGGAPSVSPSVATTIATPNAVLSSAELKCKYRTGKCSNVRALKSCGDYHNLCNYHRLRANANQRKLDRKKKVQRQQTTPGSAVSSPQAETAPESSVATMSPSSSSSPASVSAAAALCNPSATAAAALVSMPTSAPPPVMLFHHQQQRYEDAAAPLFAPQASAPVGVGSLEQPQQNSSSSNSLRVKQEDRCMQ